eukprot:COSAG01_NODE_9377_length_2463_cov_18.677242_2_plen_101_part_00
MSWWDLQHSTPPPPRSCEGVTAGAPVLPQLMGMTPRLSPAMIALPLPLALLLPVEDGSPPHRHLGAEGGARALRQPLPQHTIVRRASPGVGDTPRMQQPA